MDQTFRRVKIKILTIMRFGGSLRAKKKDESHESSDHQKNRRRRSSIQRAREFTAEVRKDFKKTALQVKNDFQTRVTRWYSKMRGGNAGEAVVLSFPCTTSFIFAHFAFIDLALMCSSLFHLDTNFMEFRWGPYYPHDPFAIKLFHHVGDRRHFEIESRFSSVRRSIDSPIQPDTSSGESTARRVFRTGFCDHYCQLDFIHSVPRINCLVSYCACPGYHNSVDGEAWHYSSTCR
jgi:hypothetical protein